MAVAKVEAEGDGVGRSRHNDFPQRVERRQRFKSHDDPGCAAVEGTSGLRDRRDACVQPQSGTRLSDRADSGIVFGTAGDRVQIGQVQLVDAKLVDVQAC